MAYAYGADSDQTTPSGKKVFYLGQNKKKNMWVSGNILENSK